MPYTAKQVREYRAANKARLIQAFGGSCVKCGSTTKLEFDHIDPKTKIVSIARLNYSLKAKQMAVEIVKCQLLCWECHHLKTLADNGWQDARNIHGAPGSYRWCHCSICKEANAARLRRYYHSTKMVKPPF